MYLSGMDIKNTVWMGLRNPPTYTNNEQIKKIYQT